MGAPGVTAGTVTAFARRAAVVKDGNTISFWGDTERTSTLSTKDEMPLAAVALTELSAAWLTTAGAVRTKWVPGEQSQPTIVTRIESGVVQLVGGMRTTVCARTMAGAVLCWNPASGRTAGDPIAGLTDVTYIAGDGERILYAVKSDGTVLSYEFLATPKPPAAVAGLTGVAKISVSGKKGCVLSPAGALRCWGDNMFGLVGDGTMNPHATPADAVEILQGVADVGFTSLTGCARMMDNTVRCWGNNVAGGLGAGTPGNTMVGTPTAVPGINDARALGIGTSSMACVERADSAVWCWGSNDAAKTPALGTPTQIQLGAM
jgi:hypothetical protein